jgi:hypothetical protein
MKHRPRKPERCLRTGRGLVAEFVLDRISSHGGKPNAAPTQSEFLRQQRRGTGEASRIDRPWAYRGNGPGLENLGPDIAIGCGCSAQCLFCCRSGSARNLEYTSPQAMTFLPLVFPFRYANPQYSAALRLGCATIMTSWADAENRHDHGQGTAIRYSNSAARQWSPASCCNACWLTASVTTRALSPCDPSRNL